MSNKDTIIEALTMQLKIEREGNLALVKRMEEAEKQEPYGYFRYDIQLDAWVQNKESAQGVAFYTAPVHASDISQERVDETAKRKHEWVGLDGDIPGLGLVTEEFYNGMLCAEDILRRRNT
jgi:hypothetical protein